MIKTSRNQENPFTDVIYPWQTGMFSNVIPFGEALFGKDLFGEDPLAHTREEYNPPRYREFSPEGMQAELDNDAVEEELSCEEKAVHLVQSEDFGNVDLNANEEVGETPHEERVLKAVPCIGKDVKRVKLKADTEEDPDNTQE